MRRKLYFEQYFFNLLQTSRKHILNRRRACCSASAFALNSDAFGIPTSVGTFGSSGRDK